jgi:hypothetical protein
MLRRPAMVSFIRKLLVWTRPYRVRLILGILLGVMAGVNEALLVVAMYFVFAVVFPQAGGDEIRQTIERLSAYAPDLARWLGDRIDSLACAVEARTPARSAAPSPTSSAGVAPNSSPIGCWSGNAASMTTAVVQPTNADSSIIPSMPIFTTPVRSFMNPHRAPSAIGVHSATMTGAIEGRTWTR